MEKNMLLVICMAAVLLSAGCNGPSGTKETTGSTQAVSEEKTVTTQKSESGSKPSGGVLDDITGLFASRPVEYMVEYKTSITMKNEEESAGTMAFYYRGADQIRTDMYMDNMESRYYLNKDDFVMCNNQGGEWSCMKIQKGQSQQQDVNKNMDDLKKNVETNPVTRLPDRVIIGIICKCFNVKVTVNMQRAKETGLSEIESISCVSPQGVPLYTESKSEGMSSIQEATRYSTSVSDADFVPPAEPKDMMEALGGGSVANPGQPAGGKTPETDVEDAMDAAEGVGGTNCDICDKAPTEEAAQSCRKALNC